MSNRCTILLDDEKHVFWECNDDAIYLIFDAMADCKCWEKFKNVENGPRLSKNELIKLFAYMMNSDDFLALAAKENIYKFETTEKEKTQ